MSGDVAVFRNSSGGELAERTGRGANLTGSRCESIGAGNRTATTVSDCCCCIVVCRETMRVACKAGSQPNAQPPGFGQSNRAPLRWMAALRSTRANAHSHAAQQEGRASSIRANEDRSAAAAADDSDRDERNDSPERSRTGRADFTVVRTRTNIDDRTTACAPFVQAQRCDSGDTLTQTCGPFEWRLEKRTEKKE